MATFSMKELLSENRSNLALIIGNGVNIFGADKERENLWENLLSQLANKHLPGPDGKRPDSLAFTEFYDILELKSVRNPSPVDLQRDFCKSFSSWEPRNHHKTIVEWAINYDVPILTTNFDSLLAQAGNCTLKRSKKGGFTAYYPWESYYSPYKHSLADPGKEFGIWHINGLAKYRQSIRLGLTHYMGSVERARNWLRRGTNSLFFGKNPEKWKGASSWLDLIFKKPLLIFGLKLETNEVFLRWLLIERARYFKKHPDLRQKAWFVEKKPSKEEKLSVEAKRYFLKNVDVETLEVDQYDDMYALSVWS